MALGITKTPYETIGQCTFRYLFYLICSTILIFLALPVLVVIPISFTSGSFLSFPLPGLSLRWYHEFFSSPFWVNSLKNSLYIALLTTLVSLILGTMAAFGLASLRSRLTPVIFAFLLSPMIIPTIILAVGAYGFFSYFSLNGTFAGIVIAHSILATPFVLIVVHASLKNFDRSLVQAAAGLGASPLRTFWLVTAPLISPSILSAAVLAFAASLDEVVMALFLVGPNQRTLPIQMFTGLREQLSPTIAAAAVIMLALAISLLLAIEVLRSRGEVQTSRK